MMRGSNMGILPYGLILLVTWGLGRIRTIATPLGWLKSHDIKSLGGLVVFNHSYTSWLAQCHYLGAKECCQEQLKHRHPLSTAQNVAWGFFAIAMNKEIYTCNRLSSRGLEAWYIHLKPRVSLPI